MARNLLEHPSRTPLDRRAEKAIELLFARDHGGGEAIARFTATGRQPIFTSAPGEEARAGYRH